MSDITEKTRVPLSMAASFVIVIIGCTFWVNSTISGLQANLKDLAYEIKALNTRLNALTEDRWTSTDMRHWTDQLLLMNPGFRVPTVERKR